MNLTGQAAQKSNVKNLKKEVKLQGVLANAL